jgi:hypothetical protein
MAHRARARVCAVIQLVERIELTPVMPEFSDARNELYVSLITNGLSNSISLGIIGSLNHDLPRVCDEKESIRYGKTARTIIDETKTNPPKLYWNLAVMRLRTLYPAFVRPA